MELTLTTGVERCRLDLDRFLELWPHLGSRDLLQALEASQGKSVGVFVGDASTTQSHVEILIDHDTRRAAVDSGSGARWGACAAEDAGYRISLDDGSGDWVLTGSAIGATARWLPHSS